MVKKSLPYIFLLLLVLVLIFIGGVKYGQKVEETNKVIKFVMSITPTQKPPSPKPTSVLEFQTTTICDMSFMIPSYLKKIDNGAESFVDADGKSMIVISCYDPADPPDSSPDTVKEHLEMVGGFTSAASLSGQSKNSVQNKVYIDNDFRNIRLIHPKTKDFVSIYIHSGLFPLIEKTLEFTTPVPTKKPAATGIISP